MPIGSESIALRCPRCNEERDNPRAAHPPGGFISIHLTVSPELCDACRAAVERSRADVVMVAKIDPREPRSLYDSAGRKIGEVAIDGDTGTARITDPAVAAAVKAQAVKGAGFSMGYRVTLEPVPAESARCGLLLLDGSGAMCTLPAGHGGHTQDGGCSRWDHERPR